MKNALLAVITLLTTGAFAQAVPPPPPPPPPGPEVKVVQSAVIDFPEVEAEFPGGQRAMQKYIQENVRYPEVARQLGEQGRVYVKFIVERDGSISNIEIMRGVSKALDAEAIRLVKEMPLWIPAEVKNKKVRALCRLPIAFVLTPIQEEKKK